MKDIFIRKTLVCASSEGSRESAHPYKWTLTGNGQIMDQTGGIFDGISSFIAYAQSLF